MTFAKPPSTLTLSKQPGSGPVGGPAIGARGSIAGRSAGADGLLADIRELAPSIAARSAEFEARRQLPADLMQVLKEIGIYRALVPKSYGGMELDILSGFEIMEALSRIDGSFGWNTTLGLGTPVLASLLPREIYDEVYRHGPNVIFAASIQPAGTAEAVEGGWRVNGRWPFASGCQHADWILAGCVMMQDGRPLPGPAEGVPLIRFVYLPARQWQMEDTWHATGLRGTGSHHVVLSDALVRSDHFIDIMGSTPWLPGPLYNAPMHFVPLMHGPIATGGAAAALDDIIEMAASGRRQLRAAQAMRDSELFQFELGRAQAELRAAKAYLRAQTASHWDHACAGTLSDAALMVEGTQASIWVTTACVRVAEICFALGGGSAVYANSPLQRRMRDLQAAAQHAAVQQRHYVDSGKLLLS